MNSVMKSVIKRSVVRAILAAVLAVMLLPAPAYSWNYSNVPLFWDAGINPNVVLMLDDSRSMQAIVVNESFQRALEGGTLPTQDWYWCSSAYDYVNKRCTTKNSTAIDDGFGVQVWTPPAVSSVNFTVGRSWYTGITTPASCGSTSSGFFKSGSGTTSTTSYTASGICLANHSMPNGTLVEYVSGTTGGATTLSTSQTYYVINSNTHGFQLSTTFNGSATTFNITLGSSGSWTFRRYRPSTNLPAYINNTGGTDITTALCDVTKLPGTAGFFIGPNGAQTLLSTKTLPTTDQVGVLVSNTSGSNTGTRDSCIRWKLASTARSTNMATNSGRDYDRWQPGTLYYTPGTSDTDAYGGYLVNTLLPSTGNHSINFDNSIIYPDSDSDPSNWVPATDNMVIPNVTRMQAAREVAQNVVLDFYDKMNIGLFSFDSQMNTAVPDGTNPAASKLALIGANESTLASSMPTAALDGSIGLLNAENGTPLAKTQAAINTYFSGSSSPIKYRCQKNYAVVMTDGDPSGDTGTLDANAQTGFDTDCKTTGVDADGVSWNDPSSGGKWAKQNIITYTLGFGLENNLLKRTPLLDQTTIPKSDINATADTIKLPKHGLETGDYFQVVSQTGAVSGLTTGNFYYVAKVDADTFRVAGAAAAGDTSGSTTNNRPKATQCASTATVTTSGPCLPLTGGSGNLVISTGPGDSFFSFTPEQLALDLGAVFNRINNLTSSASAVSTNTKQFGGDTLVYQARFNTEDWSGEVAAYKIVLNPDGTASVDTSDTAIPQWTTKSTLNTPAQRTTNLFTWKPSTNSAVSFSYSNLTSTQQTAIGGATNGANVVNWLKGQTVAGFRDHSTKGLLGDILNSDPVYLSNMNLGYKSLPPSQAPCSIASDSSSASGSGCTGAEIYATYVKNTKTREPILYVGANDGMLHGLNANTGAERMAFIPNAVYQDWDDTNNNGVNDDSTTENKLFNLTQNGYDHRYFVDGSLSVGDVFLNSVWNTYLVGALGRGGRSIFAIDVTDTTFNASDIKWEFTNANLGYTYGKPIIARLADGKWYAIFPNGLDSNGDNASVFLVNLDNPTDFHELTTNDGSTSPNGMMVVQVKVNVSRTVTDIYAGDMLGNIWKFDVYNEGTSSVTWPSTGTKLFTARDPSNMVQSITGGLRLGTHPDGLGTMVFFGTGKYFETQDNVFSTTSVPQVDTFYGVLDHVDGSSTNLVRADLQVQSFTMATVSGETVRTASSNTVDYPGGEKGWYIDLLDGTTKLGERVVSTPVLYGGRIIFVSIKPLSGGTCGGEGTSWLNELDALNGMQLDYPVLDTNGDGIIDSNDGKISSMQMDGLVSEPSIITGQDTDFKVMGSTSTSKSVQVVSEEPAPEGGLPGGKGRMSWRQLQ